MLSALPKEGIARYALEAILIVFSVLLALFLDQELAERREAQTIKEVVSHVTDEMRSNLAIIDKWLPYHQGIVAEIDRYLSDGDLQQSLLSENGIGYSRLMERGIIQDFYSTSSWQLAQQSEATPKLDFGVTYAISLAYRSQAYVDRTLQQLADFFFDRATYDPEQLAASLIVLRGLVQELSGQESVLLGNYCEALEQIALQASMTNKGVAAEIIPETCPEDP